MGSKSRAISILVLFSLALVVVSAQNLPENTDQPLNFRELVERMQDFWRNLNVDNFPCSGANEKQEGEKENPPELENDVELSDEGSRNPEILTDSQNEDNLYLVSVRDSVKPTTEQGSDLEEKPDSVEAHSVLNDGSISETPQDPNSGSIVQNMEFEVEEPSSALEPATEYEPDTSTIITDQDTQMGNLERFPERFPWYGPWLKFTPRLHNPYLRFS